MNLARQYQKALQDQNVGDFNKLRENAIISDDDDYGYQRIEFPDGSVYTIVETFSESVGYGFERTITDTYPESSLESQLGID